MNMKKLFSMILAIMMLALCFLPRQRTWPAC